MFSAFRFIAAGVIVALFGGFLLAGVLTTPQGDEVLPAAVTESPSPMTTEELLSGMATEEVEPGIHRVIGDGEIEFQHTFDQQSRPDHLVSGGDGGIWLLSTRGYRRLGGDKEGIWPDGVHYVNDFEVAPDGTIWAAWGEGFDGQAQTDVYSHPGHNTTVPERASDMGWERHPVGGYGGVIEVTSDGTVWSSWWDEPTGSDVFGYLGADGWQPVGEVPYFGSVHVSDMGDIWAFSVEPPSRFVDGAWQQYTAVDLSPVSPTDVGPDGTVWGISSDENDLADQVVRFDGSQWQEWEPPDWLAPDHHNWRWNEDEWVEATQSDADGNLGVEGLPGDLQVAPDGSVWVVTRLGMWGDQPVCTDVVSGVARFDGETWSRFLRDQCVESMDIASDGSVWLLASETDARFPLLRTYVITPEAVVATE